MWSANTVPNGACSRTASVSRGMSVRVTFRVAGIGTSISGTDRVLDS
jgi:hypothetical protein